MKFSKWYILSDEWKEEKTKGTTSEWMKKVSGNNNDARDWEWGSRYSNKFDKSLRKLYTCKDNEIKWREFLCSPIFGCLTFFFSLKESAAINISFSFACAETFSKNVLFFIGVDSPKCFEQHTRPTTANKKCAWTVFFFTLAFSYSLFS